MYSLFTCFWAYRSFLSYKCFFFRKKPEIYWSGGTPPSIGKRPIYIRFFLLKASLRLSEYIIPVMVAYQPLTLVPSLALLEGIELPITPPATHPAPSCIFCTIMKTTISLLLVLMVSYPALAQRNYSTSYPGGLSFSLSSSTSTNMTGLMSIIPIILAFLVTIIPRLSLGK